MNEPPHADPSPLPDQFWAEYGRDFDPGPPPPTRLELAVGFLSYLLAAAAVGGAVAAVWTLVPPTFSPLALGSSAGLAGLVTCAGAFHALTRLEDLMAARRRSLRPKPEGSPMYILHGPPSDLLDPQARPLEERLLALCKDDWKLLERLVEGERQRHPYSTRAELLQLAIDHYLRDHKR